MLYKIALQTNNANAINEFNSRIVEDQLHLSKSTELFYSEGMDKLEGDFMFIWNEYYNCYTLDQITK